MFLVIFTSFKVGFCGFEMGASSRYLLKKYEFKLRIDNFLSDTRISYFLSVDCFFITIPYSFCGVWFVNVGKKFPLTKLPFCKSE